MMTENCPLALLVCCVLVGFLDKEMEEETEEYAIVVKFNCCKRQARINNRREMAKQYILFKLGVAWMCKGTV